MAVDRVLDKDMNERADHLPEDFQVVVTVREDEHYYRVVFNDPDDELDEGDDVEEFSECGGSYVLGAGFKLSVALNDAVDAWARILDRHPEMLERVDE